MNTKLPKIVHNSHMRHILITAYLPMVHICHVLKYIYSSNPQPIVVSGILLAKRKNSFYCTYILHNRNVADTKSPSSQCSSRFNNLYLKTPRGERGREAPLTNDTTIKNTLTHASVFSGIGGAELAASWMGWKNLFHCEIQQFPRQVLDYWFPNSESYADITKTTFTKWKGKVDVLTGGFPCQPFSYAGSRKGAEDDRYLWPEMLRAIREIQPTWVVAENVVGITTMVQPSSVTEMGRSDFLFEESVVCREEYRYILDAICEDIEREGYEVQPLVIPACATGAPHRRNRIWIVAHLNIPHRPYIVEMERS